jgi:hypothetical protein
MAAATSADRARGMVCVVDADGDVADDGQRLVAGDLEPIRVHVRFDVAVDRVQEILAVVPDVEPEEVVTQESVEQFLPPGEDATDLPVRPRDVPKLRDNQLRVCRLEHPGEQAEVIVLNEHERRLVAGLREHDVGEQSVHLPISVPVLGAEDRWRERDVAERPQALVRQTVVESLLLFFAQPDPPERVRRVVRRDTNPVPFVHHVAIRVPAPVCDPGSAARLHQRVDRRCHPAGRFHHRDLVTDIPMDVRFAVRNHDELDTRHLRGDQLS